MSGSESTTKEKFPAGTTRRQMDEQASLKIKAGALSSKFSGNQKDGWILVTKWEKI